MRDFKSAKELFKDKIDTNFYFDSISAEVSRHKIEMAVKNKDVPLIFLIGDPGVGKSHLIRVIIKELGSNYPTVLIDHPFFDKRDLLRILYEAQNVEFDSTESFNTLKNRLLKLYEKSPYTVFIDEAQLLNEEQLELIRILSDTKVFQFVLSMHKEEGEEILQKKHFKSRTKLVVAYGNLHSEEVYRYIQSTLLRASLGEVANMFNKKTAKKITKYCNGNFRTIKKFLYSLFELLDYAKTNGLKKHSKINSCLLHMSALDIGVV